MKIEIKPVVIKLMLEAKVIGDALTRKPFIGPKKKHCTERRKVQGERKERIR